MTGIINKSNYIITYNSQRVEGWSAKAIPFELKDWQKEMKGDLKKALKALEPKENSHLYAFYSAGEDRFCDVENLLLYNIGSGAFTKCAKKGLWVERGYKKDTPPKGVPYAMEHHYYYEILPKGGFMVQKPKEPLARWQGPWVNKVKDKASFYWAYVKGAQVEPLVLNHQGPYGIKLTIHSPRAINLTGYIKTMVDGALSAFHRQKGEISPQVLNCLCSQTGEGAARVKEWLYDDALCVLGERRLVQDFKKSMQWNPADDRCVAIEMIYRHAPMGWKIEGEIFSVI